MVSRVRSNLSGFRARAQIYKTRIVKSVNDAIREEMLAVRDEARALSPVEYGRMEKAIKLVGENQRRKWVVYIDENMPDDTGEYRIGDYVDFLHEGTYNLGEDSRQKANASGKPVGRKFLERAFVEKSKGMMERLTAKARAAGLIK